MLLYTEEDLDRAYKLDCKERTKQDKPWITHSDFRDVYEELIEVYLDQVDNETLDTMTIDNIPSWVIEEVEHTLQNKIIIETDDDT